MQMRILVGQSDALTLEGKESAFGNVWGGQGAWGGEEDGVS